MSQEQTDTFLCVNVNAQVNIGGLHKADLYSNKGKLAQANKGHGGLRCTFCVCYAASKCEMLKVDLSYCPETTAYLSYCPAFSPLPFSHAKVLFAFLSQARMTFVPIPMRIYAFPDMVHGFRSRASAHKGLLSSPSSC